ncbi:phage portal protein [Gluconobacter thailandicus]|uniref:Phage portal protein n=1 Tax=Gluconobacter thailandicus TaxID=257438 RepID=A0AAP9JIV1_GLUTH|nr:phage portal protein [Gluconobacter thailandicus]QEH97295.1 phage portal protein [Gluconobacter thailandicus]
MDWLSLRSTYPNPKGQPERCGRLLALRRVLDGSQYDGIPNDFATERSGAGEYIPLSRRRPSVRTNMCRTVVEDSVSLLFGDTHWPSFVANSPETVEALTAFSSCAGLEQIFNQAAIQGSIGSVAVLAEVAENVPRLTLLDTAFLTPHWSADNGELTAVYERYTVKGRDLAAQGYVIPEDNMAVDYWWQRTWTVNDCEILTPWPVAAGAQGARDENRSVRHGLGFVPIVWIRNLGGCSDDPDGDCTFERAIDTVIEADYLLSQAGRGLKYGSDPTLVLKTGGMPGGPAREGGASSALTLPPEGDAKLLEINGNAAEAVLGHYRELRAIVLEQLHGNRAHADKISAAQSGRAMEMMCLPLIWLADRLRQSYGAGLCDLLRMICRFTHVVNGGLKIDGAAFTDLEPSGIGLHWPPWFAPTEPELLQLAQGLVTAVDGGLISNETACTIYSARIGIADAASEWAKISEELSKGTRVAKSAETTRKDSNSGKTLSHQVTA